jgi:GDPmannose 4,6-dehydratase
LSVCEVDARISAEDHSTDAGGNVKRVLVTGVTGQLGYYVAERLTAAGDEVYGVERQSTLGRAGGKLPYIPVAGDLLDDYSLLSLVDRIQPAEIYNFAGQSSPAESWNQPVLTAHYTGLGVLRLLEVVRRYAPSCRVLQAGSSELFAQSRRSPQDEQTPVAPGNPYGVAKAFAFHTMHVYREKYGLFACNAVFYTNESPRRSTAFLARKVTHAVAEIEAGRLAHLELGDLAARRDWGWAPDYADAAVRALRHDAPEDFVIATGEAHSVEELVAEAFARVGRDWRAHVRVAAPLVRPVEPQVLVGDPRKAERLLGWRAGVRFREVVQRLMEFDLERAGIRGR